MPEKAAQQILAALYRVGRAACSVGQRVNIEGGIIREGIGFEVGPQVFDGIEFGSVRRKVFQVCRTRQDAFVDEFALVGLEAIPDQHDGRVQLMLKMLEEIHCELGVDVGIRMESKVQRNSIPFGQDAYCGDGRNLLMRTSALAQHRCLPTHAPGAAHQGGHEHPGFVEENEGRSQARGVFFTRGQSCSIQARMRSSSRSTARRVGFCGEKPKPCRTRLTCAG
jgi:hypothetical protein